MSIDLSRAQSTITNISNDANQIAQSLTGVMNTVSIARAMQEGYKMACRDNGLPIPEMTDPLEEMGLRGVL
ncbi:hypothetical protein RPALISO_100 [Ruegeria phage RpAliso]|nr:hypothetical protein RPALISO_100 [Ruegeria phage RpAliso]